MNFLCKFLRLTLFSVKDFLISSPISVYKILGLGMANTKLNKLCMDEDDPMLNAEVRCKHGILLQMQTSWSDWNSGRRFWSCPHYEVCVHVLSLSINLKINVNWVVIEFFKFQATNCKFFKWRDNERVDERSKLIFPRLVNKIKELEENYDPLKLHLDELEDSKKNIDSKEKSMKGKNRRNLCRKFIWCIMVCVVVVYVSSLIQLGNSKKNQMELPMKLVIVGI